MKEILFDKLMSGEISLETAKSIFNFWQNEQLIENNNNESKLDLLKKMMSDVYKLNYFSNKLNQHNGYYKFSNDQKEFIHIDRDFDIISFSVYIPEDRDFNFEFKQNLKKYKIT